MSGAQAAPVPAGRGGGSDISSRERQQILDQIDQLVAGARKPADGAVAAYRASRSGALFPLVVNLVAAALIAAGAYFLPRLFDRGEQAIVARSVERPVGEGGIVTAVVSEGEEKLAAKDREIVGIRSRIDDLGQELVALRSGRDAEIARREEALRGSLATGLAVERDRLEKAGTAAASLEKQLAALEQRRTAELEAQLESFRRQKDAELAAKEQEIDARFAAYQRDLAAANRARTALEGELSAAEATGAVAVSEQQRLARELAAVSEQARREELAVGQLTTAWQSVAAAMKAGLWDAALARLDGISALLGQEALASLPAVHRRAASDAFLVESMRRLVAADRGDPSAGGAAAAAQEAADLVSQAESELKAGETKTARELYLAAIAKLPALQTAHERLSAMEGGGGAAAKQAVAEALAEADAAYAAGNWKSALDRYGRALGLLKDTAKDLPRAATRIADAGYRLSTADQAARQDRAAKTLVEKADGLVQRGSLDEALVTYASVLDSYPLSSQVGSAVTGIESVVDARIAAKQSEIAALQKSLAETDNGRQAAAADAAAAKAEAAAARTDAAAKDKVAADALAREKARQDAGDRAEAAALERMKTATDGLASAARTGGKTADAARKELISLLQAKVLVKEALNSESVKSQHPDLNANLDRYIELYGEQKKAEGSAAALADVSMVSDYLLEKKSAGDLAAVWARYAEETQRSALQQVLDRLKALLP